MEPAHSDAAQVPHSPSTTRHGTGKIAIRQLDNSVARASRAGAEYGERVGDSKAEAHLEA